MRAKTLLKEELEPNAEIMQEFGDLEKRIGQSLIGVPKAHRLTFFAAPCQGNKWQSLPASSFLGYAVVLTTKLPTDVPIVQKRCPSGDLAYILESVTRPPGWADEVGPGNYQVKGVTNYYVHCQRRFKTTVGFHGDSRDYSVDGAMFCQQNALTHVCAHAVLRVILNTANLVGHHVTNRELNDILGIDHVSHMADTGLNIEQVLAIIQHFNLSIVGGDFLELPAVDYAEWIYPLVESGYPVFLTFNPTHAEGHVVAVLGHTLNTDKWDCEAHLAYRPEAFGTYHASAAWVDHFIVNDDNFGMYTCMPPHYLRNKVMPQYDTTQRAIHALSVLPSGIDCPPYLAEKVSIFLVRNRVVQCLPSPNNKWLGRLREQVGQARKGVVARTLLCKRDDYITHLMALRDSDGNGPINVVPNALQAAPEFLWLTEVALPDLYTANKHKLGDILTDAKTAMSGGRPAARFVWGWLPGIQISNDAAGNVSEDPWPLAGHVPILRPSTVLGPHQEW